ncbi:carboxypeptidase-like regulatory domain-containing protein [Portibacter lacus]|uniref:Carboxypeptidase-like regulatory domain-containing protein n=1 Tax=Portibacter lacus TaxID=1099794 RepID=A0AA37SP12_9BACT|nr:carboxypeptidase-like regulatory domain-containing protein [Portibacter lacus]GLR17335.1 hypothetical protein GCM10007940_19500 [Portibacter lacus]
MKIRIHLIILFIFSSNLGLGQLFHGSIIDAGSAQPVAFSNIVFQESLRGTMSNEMGEFIMLVDESELTDTLLFSNLGYANLKIAYKDIIEENEIVKLHKLSNNQNKRIIGEKSAKAIVKKALDGIVFNYPQENHLLTGFYNEKMEHEDGRIFYYCEGVTEELKDKYWKNPSLFYSQNFRLKEGKRIIDGFYETFYGFKVEESENVYRNPVDIIGGLKPFHNDVLKMYNSFLIKEYIKHYNWKLSGITLHKNRLANIITFTPKNKKALYKGEIFIDAKNYAILYSKFELADHLLSNINKENYWFEFKSMVIEVDYRKVNFVHILGSVKIRTTYQQKITGETFNSCMNYVTTNCSFKNEDIINFTDGPVIRNNDYPINEDRIVKFSEGIYYVEKKNLVYTGEGSNYWNNHNTIQRADRVQQALNHSLGNRKQNIQPIQMYVSLESSTPVIDYGQIYSEKVVDFYKTLSHLDSSLTKDWRKDRGILLSLILEATDSNDLDRVREVLKSYRQNAITYEWEDLQSLILFKKGSEQKALSEQQNITLAAGIRGILYRTTLQIYRDKL